MARTTLKADDRKAMILDAAQRLFTTKGFQATTIEDILVAVGVAKGTLYYHYRSKEEIMHALISRTVDTMERRALAIAGSEAPPAQKLLGVISSARVDDHSEPLKEQFHAPGNAEFHLAGNLEVIRRFTPILVAVVEEGIAAGQFATDQPREDIEILLTAAFVLTDDALLIGDEADRLRRLGGLVRAAERLLGCPPGTLTAR